MVKYLSRGMYRILVDFPVVLLPLNKTAYKHSRTDWAEAIDFQSHNSLFFKSDSSVLSMPSQEGLLFTGIMVLFNVLH